MNEKKTNRARVQMLLIAAVFFGPLAVASWMYYGGHFQPQGKTNHGALLEPITNVADAAPESAIIEIGDGYWLLMYADSAECLEACKSALYTLRQSRKMLGKEMDRLKRVFLYGDSAPDSTFLAEEHAGLITLQNDSSVALLADKKPAELLSNGFFLVDPLGNLVMYFQPDINPSDMVDDIKRLLKLSRIG